MNTQHPSFPISAWEGRVSKVRFANSLVPRRCLGTKESGGPTVPLGRSGREATRSLIVREQLFRARPNGASCKRAFLRPTADETLPCESPRRCNYLTHEAEPRKQCVPRQSLGTRRDP